ncbi:MAG: AI-2E family transporter, partial [Bacilli bacterium]
VIFISKRILKITYFLVILLGIYGVIMVLKELNAIDFLLTILKIVSPLFIGIFIAWLFDPTVKWLKHKGIRRGLGASLVYIIFLAIVFIVCWSIVPVLSQQINDFVKIVPEVFGSIKDWATELFLKLDNIKNFDALALQHNFFARVEEIGMNLTTSLPDLVVNFVTSVFSGIGIIVIGLIIGFYLLVSFDSATDSIITVLPKRMHKDARDLANEINTSLRRFVIGALIDACLVFIVTSLGFSLVGLKAPLLFGLFCGFTNIIPYAGPYIGGIPAVIVGFSEGILVGILVLVVIVVIQFLEGNFLQPVIMSKTVKLHPVTIIIGLLVFGYFWGIIGMLVSTPLIASIKAIINFFDEKYNFLNYNGKERI